MINKTILVGRVGKDPETKQITDKATCTSFTLATNKRIKKGEAWEDKTTWHNVKAWNIGKLADHIKKGKIIYVEGEINNDSYEKDGVVKYFSEVVCTVINPFISGDGNNQAATNENPQPPVDEELLPF